MILRYTSFTFNWILLTLILLISGVTGDQDFFKLGPFTVVIIFAVSVLAIIVIVYCRYICRRANQRATTTTTSQIETPLMTTTQTASSPRPRYQIRFSDGIYRLYRSQSSSSLTSERPTTTTSSQFAYPHLMSHSQSNIPTTSERPTSSQIAYPHLMYPSQSNPPVTSSSPTTTTSSQMSYPPPPTSRTVPPTRPQYPHLAYPPTVRPSPSYQPLPPSAPPSAPPLVPPLVDYEIPPPSYSSLFPDRSS